MGFDALLKRYFAAFVCLLIGMAAYFQASGMGALVASSVALDPSSLPAFRPTPPRPPQAAPNEDHATTATAIIERNPFDSVTGPLTSKTLDLTPEPVKQVDRDPYDDPDCDFAKVVLIMSADDPQWSFAALAGSDGKSVLRRQGDEVAGHTIDYIGDRRTEEQRAESTLFEVYDRVWFTSQGGARCQAKMGGKAPPKVAKEVASRPKSGLAKDISNKIHKVSETEFNVDRSVVDTHPREPGRADEVCAHRPGEGGRQGRRHPPLRHPPRLAPRHDRHRERGPALGHQRLRAVRSAEGARSVHQAAHGGSPHRLGHTGTVSR